MRSVRLARIDGLSVIAALACAGARPKEQRAADATKTSEIGYRDRVSAVAATHEKLAASSVLPVPFHLAT
jgi:hypothetical protein